MFFFFNDTATTEIYTLSLHDALPISLRLQQQYPNSNKNWSTTLIPLHKFMIGDMAEQYTFILLGAVCFLLDRKSTRLNSSHLVISYAVFCLKKTTTEHARASATRDAT